MANIKYKSNGEYKDIVVKVGDTLPIGAIIGFDTTQTIPNGWEYYAENQIKKIAPVTPANGNIENTYGTSQENTYSQEYINNLNTYSTDEIRIGTYLGKPLYRKVIESGILPNATANQISTGISNLDTFVRIDGIAYNTSNEATPFPNSNLGTNNGTITIEYANDSIYIKTNVDLRKYTKSFLILEYTKTTD